MGAKFYGRQDGGSDGLSRRLDYVGLIRVSQSRYPPPLLQGQEKQCCLGSSVMGAIAVSRVLSLNAKR